MPNSLMTSGRRGFTMVEVFVAVVILMLALMPLSTVISASNRTSNVSVYEIMAVHYAAELAEQLNRLSPTMLRQIRLQTGKALPAPPSWGNRPSSLPCKIIPIRTSMKCWCRIPGFPCSCRLSIPHLPCEN